MLFNFYESESVEIVNSSAYIVHIDKMCRIISISFKGTDVYLLLA